MYGRGPKKLHEAGAHREISRFPGGPVRHWRKGGKERNWRGRRKRKIKIKLPFNRRQPTSKQDTQTRFFPRDPFDTMIYERFRRCISIPSINFLGQGFQQLQNYRQTGRCERITTPHSLMLKTDRKTETEKVSLLRYFTSIRPLCI